MAPPLAPSTGPSSRRSAPRGMPKSRSRARPKRSMTTPVELTRSSPRNRSVPFKRPASGCKVAACSRAESQPGRTSTSSLTRAAKSAPPARARRSATLLARPYPAFSGNRNTVTSGNSARRIPSVPSVDALSTTTISTATDASRASAWSARRQAGRMSAPRWVATMAWVLGAFIYVVDPPPLLSVGINAAPLLAPRTGVGRYIAGLLQSLDAHPAPDLRCIPLFAPRAAAGDAGGPPPLVRAASLVRALVKRLPASYDLAQAARAASLAARRDLSLYHETNHAAPRFRGPVVVTIHDLSTVRFPETQDPARARRFSRPLRA